MACTTSVLRSLLSTGHASRRCFSSSGVIGMSHHQVTALEKRLIEQDSHYLMGLYPKNDHQLAFVRGEGCYLLTETNEKYLDCFSGIAVGALGHSDPEIVEIMKDQVGKLIHLSNFFHHEWGAPCAERLVKSCGAGSFADKVYFANSGAEANEFALKIAKKLGGETSPEKFEIISFKGAFHGRTAGALSVTYKENYRVPYLPLVPGVHFAELNNIESVEKVISNRTAAVIIEPVQGEGGIVESNGEFLQQVRQLCDKHKTLLIFDEVQAGLGRTGTFWAYQNEANNKVQPDVLTFAKPIAGGLPMGGVIVSADIGAKFKPGDHGTTFGGGPLVTRVACHVIDRVGNAEFLQQVKGKGLLLKGLLDTLQPSQRSKIKQIRGRGLLIGVEIDRPVAPLLDHAREEGLLMINAGEKVLRLCPPLIINNDQLRDIAAAVGRGLDAI